MKKLILLLLAVGALVAFVGIAQAQAQGESEVFYFDEATQTWLPNPLDLELRQARLFRLGEQAQGNCNREKWLIPVVIRASVGQWIDWKLGWTEWQWYIRKPGCFAGNSIEARLASNGDVLVDYEGFGPLMPDPQGPCYDPTHTPIDVSYSFETNGGGFAEANARGWTSAVDLNASDDLLKDVIGTGVRPWPLHYGIAWKLWNKICVVQCNGACDYINRAQITLSVQCLKPWLNTDGTWKPL